MSNKFWGTCGYQKKDVFFTDVFLINIILMI